MHGLMCLCQNPYRLLISGHVTEIDTTVKICSALVHLKADDGTMREAKTDSNGYYHFDFKKIRFHKAEISLVTDRQTVPVNGSWKYGYLATRDKAVFETADSSAHYIKDFQLTLNQGCGSFPSLLFKKNMLAYDTVIRMYETQADSIYAFPEQVIRFLTLTLTDNPTIVIELSAHCSSDEKQPEKLSQMRAEKVKADLVKLGIAKQRLVAKGYGITKLLVKDDIIYRASSLREKETLIAKNRRCVFKIVSWDYKVN